MEGEEDFWLRTRLPVAEPEGLHGIASGNSQAATNKVGLQGFTRSASRTCFLMTRMPSRMLTPTSYSHSFCVPDVFLDAIKNADPHLLQSGAGTQIACVGIKLLTIAIPAVVVVATLCWPHVDIERAVTILVVGSSFVALVEAHVCVV